MNALNTSITACRNIAALLFCVQLAACGGGANGSGANGSGTNSTTMGKINDTGITANQCYQAGSDTLVACNSTEALALNRAQDGMAGRDTNAATNSSSDGNLGFSFTAVTGGCVQDNITGLMWEGKTTDGGLHDYLKTFSNYDSTKALQKFNGTDYIAPTQAEIDAATNTVGFVAAVNASKLCGYNDWRLPTTDELQSLVDYGVATPGPTIDSNWFPNVRGSAYWSSTPVVGDDSTILYVDFYGGSVYFNSRINKYYVQLVRLGK